MLRNAAGSVTVLGVILVIALGLPGINAKIPGDRALGQEPYEVGAGVTVVPPPGAHLDVTRTRPGDDRGTALFTVDGVRLVVVVDRFDGTLDEATQRLRRKITQTTGYQVTDTEHPVVTTQGVAGVQGTYTSPDRRGGYAVVVADGIAVELTVSGPELQITRVVDAVGDSITSVRFRDPA